jgi:4-carboxymuconolactone decarboxylase
MRDMTTVPRPSEPRVPLVTEPSAEVREILDGALTHDGRPLNIFAVLAHNPRILKRFNVLGGGLLNRGLLPARERELVILRVGWNARAVYEFGQHTLIGREVGLTDTEIAAVCGVGDHEWPPADHLLLTLADELCEFDCVGDDTWAALAERWEPAELVELVIVAGFYRLVSGFLNSFGVPLDDGVPGWPPGARP